MTENKLIPPQVDSANCAVFNAPRLSTTELLFSVIVLSIKNQEHMTRWFRLPAAEFKI